MNYPVKVVECTKAIGKLIPGQLYAYTVLMSEPRFLVMSPPEPLTESKVKEHTINALWSENLNCIKILTTEQMKEHTKYRGDLGSFLYVVSWRKHVTPPQTEEVFREAIPA